MGDPTADSENSVLKEEQDAQVFVSIQYIFVLYMSSCLTRALFVGWERIKR